MPLTKADVTKLMAPFKVEEHEFLNGKIYIREPVILRRLFEIDPNWSNTISLPMERGGWVTVIMTLTIKGVTKSNMGSAQIRQYKSGSNNTGEANQADKSATTDSLKRVVRSQGMGWYLPLLKNVHNYNDLRKWFEDNAALFENGTMPSNLAVDEPAPEQQPKKQPEGRQRHADKGKGKPNKHWSSDPENVELLKSKLVELGIPDSELRDIEWEQWDSGKEAFAALKSEWEESLESGVDQVLES